MGELWNNIGLNLQLLETTLKEVSEQCHAPPLKTQKKVSCPCHLSALDGGPPTVWPTWDQAQPGRPSGPSHMAGPDLCSGGPVGPPRSVDLNVLGTLEILEISIFCLFPPLKLYSWDGFHKLGD